MRTFVIGRDAGNQIVLNDKLVSRRHAQLTFLDNGNTVIKDLGSANGTFVNGNRITECTLNAGDIVKCGSLFLDWTQYAHASRASAQPANFQQEFDANPLSVQESDSFIVTNQYDLKAVFKYLTTRIFEIGDLFKTDWDKKFSIWFLKGVPTALTFIVSVIMYLKYRFAGFDIFPTILAALIFAACPFVTMYLLSLSRKVMIDRVALSSGILGFIQFCGFLCFSVYFWISYQHLSTETENIFTSGFHNHDGFNFLTLVTTLILIILVVNLSIALYLFIYKYFISIAISRSQSIYLIIIAITTNAFFQILSFYTFYLIEKGRTGIF